MRASLMLSALLFTMNAYAVSNDDYSLNLSGSERNENFTLKTSTTKTIYERATVADTCYRDVQSGYNRSCIDRPQTYCRDVFEPPRRPPPGYGIPTPGGYRRVCETRYETFCSTNPNYVREAYTCYQEKTVPRTVFGGYVTSIVNVNIANKTNGNTANDCSINFSQVDENFSVNPNCRDFIIVKNKELTVKNYSGENVTYTRNFELTLLDATQILAPVSEGIGELRLDGQNLLFRTGNLTTNKNYEMILKVVKKNLIKKDETLINRNLAPGEYSFTQNDSQSGIVRINLDRMFGGIDASKKHEVQVTIRVLDNLNNAINLGSLSTEATKKITIKD